MACSKDFNMSETVQEPSKELKKLYLEDATLECEYVDSTMLQKKGGTIIQFINSNCAGATNLIGGIRISLDDVRRIPAYLARYKNTVKLHALRFLRRHFQENQCSTGATETLTADDCGLSFTMASLSPRGITLNPSKRSEGPLFYCIFPGLTEPVFLKDDGEEEVEYAQVVNAYIHLLPTGQRRSVVIQRAKDEATKKAAEPTPPNPKKPRMQPYRPDLQSTMSSLVNEVRQLRAPPPTPPTPPPHQQFPELPRGHHIQWPPADNIPDLPDDI
jgi:hypothetical protein